MSISAKSASVVKRDAFLFASNLLTGVVVARTLGPQAMGIWIILQLIPAYAESFGRLKFDVASVYFLGRGVYRVRDVLAALHILAVAASAVIIAVAVWWRERLVDTLFPTAPAHVETYLYAMLALIPLQFIYMNLTYIHLYREDIRVYNRMVILRAVSSSVISLALLVIFQLGLTAVVVGSLAAVALGVTYGWSKVDRLEAGKARLSRSMIRDLSTYGLKLYVAGVINDLNAYVTRSIAVLYLAPASLAFLGMAQGQGQIFFRVSGALGVVVFPRFAKMEQGAAAALAARGFRVTLVIVAVGGLLAAILIYPAVRVLYGVAYLPLVVPFLLMLPGLLLTAAASTLGQYFQGVGRPDLLAKMAIAPFLIQAASAPLLLPLFGLRGAAIAYLVGLLATAGVQLVVFVRVTTLPVRQLVVQRNDIATVYRAVIDNWNRLLPGMMPTKAAKVL